MRSNHLANIVCLLSLGFLTSAQPGAFVAGGAGAGADAGPVNGLGPGVRPALGSRKGVDPPNPATPQNSNSALISETSNTARTAFSSASPSSSQVQPTTIPITRTTTVSYIPYSSASSSELSQVPAISTSTIPTRAITNGYIGSTSISSSVPSSVAMSSPARSDSGISHRNLIIILSSVLGLVGLLLILSAVFLAFRYRRGQSPFAHRGASPINDEEIASWRGTVQEQKQPIPNPTHPPTIHDANTIGLAQSPGWTWAPSPTVIQPAISHTASTIPDTPSFLAKAPNSRAGLTDETVPGADAFIPPIKRQSSRLSKAPPGHTRTKSRRSSLSAKSMWSFKESSMELKAKERSPTWFDPEDDNVGRELRDLDHNSDSPGTSIFDGLSAGGLSPRPKSRPRLWDSEEKEHGRRLA